MKAVLQFILTFSTGLTVWSNEILPNDVGLPGIIGSLFRTELSDMEEKVTAQLATQNQVISKQSTLITHLERELDILERTVEDLEDRYQHQISINEALTDKVENTRSQIKLQLYGAKIPRTCADIKSSNPFSASGNYTIDPDGVGVGEEPIEVFCNMATGATEIIHDSEDPVPVTRCLDPGCYQRKVKYDTSMKQIVALVNLSKSCRQGIMYECMGAPLQYKNKAYAWWQDRNGEKQYFWAGDGTNNHTCQCGIDGNCFDPTEKCNCDSLGPDLLVDIGFITDKSALPVTGLNFGRMLFYSSKGTHTLGRLECTGRNFLEGHPTSCEDLWNAGYILPGIYNLKINEEIRTAFCDFTKLPGDEGFQTSLEQQPTKHESAVAFQSYLLGSAEAQKLVSFNTMTLNVGDAYNPYTGYFTAPVNGVYSFSFTCSKCGESAIAYLRTGNETSGFSGYTPVEQGSVSVSALYPLRQGEQVSVFLQSGSVRGDNSKNVAFSGFLLYEA